MMKCGWRKGRPPTEASIIWHLLLEGMAAGALMLNEIIETRRANSK
jgi:hypothetical protein